MIYAGIGSQQTPPPVLEEMRQVGFALGRAGWHLRTGGARGADGAFWKGALLADGFATRFVPSADYISSDKPPVSARQRTVIGSKHEAFIMASLCHPAWQACGTTVRALHARNAHILLGEPLTDPVDLVICWTPRGMAGGGTGLGIRIANKLSIPVIDMAKSTSRDVLQKLLASITIR